MNKTVLWFDRNYCMKCNKQFSSKMSFAVHNMNYHNIPSLYYECLENKKFFKGWKRLA